MTQSPAPVDAYLTTDFIAFDDGAELSLRIGDHSVQFDALLRRHGVTSGVFITGWNPYSQPQEAEKNNRANARMRSEFATLGLTALHHVGKSSDGTWIEEGFFVLGLGDSDGLMIASAYDQHAIVVVSVGKRAELCLTDQTNRTIGPATTD